MAFDIIFSRGRLADRAPGAIKGAALAAQLVERLTGVSASGVGEPAPAVSDDWTVSLPQACETLVGLREAVSASLARGNVPVMVANTCPASLATLPVVARERPDAVVLWVDAHGDFNTPESSETGFLGGMVVAAACGLWDSGHGSGLNPQQVVIVGGRDIDEQEDALLRDAGVRVLPPSETTPESVLHAIGKAPVWIHIDWDSLEPGFVPAAYKVPDGLMPEQLRAVLAALPREQIAGIEFTEFFATDDPAVNDAALAVIEGIVSPLFSKP